MNKLPAYVELIPAYGRDYKNAPQARAAWKDGKDWMIASTGQYTSIRDQAPNSPVFLRFKNKTKVCSFPE